jgi:hypothetical protein
MVILIKFFFMSIKYEILHVEIKSNRIFVSLKLIRNGTVEIFNCIPIENVHLLVENFSLVNSDYQLDN